LQQFIYVICGVGIVFKFFREGLNCLVNYSDNNEERRNLELTEFQKELLGVSRVQKFSPNNLKVQLPSQFPEPEIFEVEFDESGTFKRLNTCAVLILLLIAFTIGFLAMVLGVLLANPYILFKLF